MKKIMAVFGTRPEAVKMCPLIRELQTRKVETVVCVTGQHKEMLRPVLDIFQVEPQYNLAIMKEGQTLFDITTAVLNGMKPVLEKEKPDTVLVHGDTSTAFAAALACFYCKIPVCHVEAGLRTYDITAPYPEEMNRRAIAIVADRHFAPTETAKANLTKEGVPENRIFVTGNTVIDAMRYTVNPSYTHEELQWAGDSRLVLITAHRRENIGKPMERMFRAIRRALEEHPDVKALYPIHMNPKVRETAKKIFDGFDRIHLIEPVDVYDCHNLMAHSHLVLTDSGGIQEEAPALGKPVLVMRDTTERPEGIQAGTLKLVGTDENTIYTVLNELLNNKIAYDNMAKAVNPYGDGHACKRIADILLS